MRVVASLPVFELEYLRELAKRNRKSLEQMAGILIRRELDSLRIGDRVGWCPGSPHIPRVRIDRRYGPRPKVDHLDKTTWTKEERDAWIMTGAVPERAMKAAARAQGSLKTSKPICPPNRSRQEHRAMMDEKPEPPAVLT